MRNVEVHAIFYGRVQGVCFRAETRQIAKRLELRGTVKNLSDGSVEIYAQGEKRVLENLLSELRKSFDVDSVAVEFFEIEDSYDEFRLIY